MNARCWFLDRHAESRTIGGTGCDRCYAIGKARKRRSLPACLVLEATRGDRRGQSGALAIAAILVDGGLQRAEGERGAADATLDDIVAHLFDHGLEAERFDLIEGHPLGDLGDDRAASLTDRAAFALKADGFDLLAITNPEIHRDQITAAGIAAAELNVGVLHPVLVAGILKVVEQILNIGLSIQRGLSFLG